MFKICLLPLKVHFLLLFIVSCSLVHCYNYGENQASNYNVDQQTRNGLIKPITSSDQKLNSGFNAQPEQDGSYTIRQPQSPTIPRSFLRSESANRNNIQANGDMALQNERAGQRLLPNNGLSKNLSPSLLPKNDNSVNSALPLASLNRLARPQPHVGSSSGFNRHQTLEQILKHKSADKFLGHGFIQQQLLSQKGEDGSFLKLHGKEEKEINGTIEVNKNGLVNANIEEIKDGRFSVMDKQNRKVGDVQLHRDVEKHLKMTENNGITNVELEKNSNAELNVERDINLYPRYGRNAANPSHKVRMHLEQNQQSRAQFEFVKNGMQEKRTIQSSTAASENNNNRFRRDTIANQQDEA